MYYRWIILGLTVIVFLFNSTFIFAENTPPAGSSVRQMKEDAMDILNSDLGLGDEWLEQRLSKAIWVLYCVIKN